MCTSPSRTPNARLTWYIHPNPEYTAVLIPPQHRHSLGLHTYIRNVVPGGEEQPVVEQGELCVIEHRLGLSLQRAGERGQYTTDLGTVVMHYRLS